MDQQHRYSVSICSLNMCKFRMRTILFTAIIWTLFQTISPLRNTPWIFTQKQPANNIIFERFEYENLNKSLFIENWVVIRQTSWNVLKINISVTLTHPINEAWLHGVLFYKYNTYQKFLIDVTHEACSFLNGTNDNPVGQYMYNGKLQSAAIEIRYKL